MSSSNNWSVYILRCRDNSLYTGISTNVLKRVSKHNHGKGAKYTKSRIPVVCVWSQAGLSESAAKKTEFKIKQLSKKDKELLIIRA